MAIRIRRVDNCIVALCAAKSIEKDGDIYLNQDIHHALTAKFSKDFFDEGFMKELIVDEELMNIMDREEIVKK